MTKRFVVIELDKTFYFIGRGRLETVENTSCYSLLFHTKDNAKRYISGRIEEIGRDHPYGIYKSLDNDGGVITLLNEKGRVARGVHLRIETVVEEEDAK